MKEIYLSTDIAKPLTTYQLKIPKSKAAMEDREREDREREEKRQKISHPAEEGVTSDVSMPPKKQILARAKADAQKILSIGTRITMAFYVKEEDENVSYEASITEWNHTLHSLTTALRWKFQGRRWIQASSLLFVIQ